MEIQFSELGLCVSNMLPGDAAAADPGITL